MLSSVPKVRAELVGTLLQPAQCSYAISFTGINKWETNNRLDLVRLLLPLWALGVSKLFKVRASSLRFATSDHHAEKCCNDSGVIVGCMDGLWFWGPFQKRIWYLTAFFRASVPLMRWDVSAAAAAVFAGALEEAGNTLMVSCCSHWLDIRRRSVLLPILMFRWLSSLALSRQRRRAISRSCSFV